MQVLSMTIIKITVDYIIWFNILWLLLGTYGSYIYLIATTFTRKVNAINCDLFQENLYHNDIHCFR